MSDEEKQNKTSLVSSESKSRSLTTRSSGLARRGLELLSSQQERVIHFPPDRSIGVLYLKDNSVKGLTKIEACGTVFIPIGKKGIFFNSPLELRILQGSPTNTGQYNHVTDSDLASLQKLTELKGINLSGYLITNYGLTNLRGLSELTSLSLSKTQITDAGLLHLSNHCNLEQIDLSNTKITGIGLTNLEKLAKLEQLIISNTQLTDAGLLHLTELP